MRQGRPGPHAPRLRSRFTRPRPAPALRLRFRRGGGRPLRPPQVAAAPHGVHGRDGSDAIDFSVLRLAYTRIFFVCAEKSFI
jgi:hypothetical protein